MSSLNDNQQVDNYAKFVEEHSGVGIVVQSFQWDPENKFPVTGTNMDRDLDYRYCGKCRTVRYKSDLEVTADGTRCRKCGSYDLALPRWVQCPHRKGAVKCPKGGKGIIKDKAGDKCLDQCDYF